MAITFGLELLCAVANQFLFKNLVLVSDAPGLFLAFVPLRTHNLDVLLERLGSVLENANLLTSSRRVTVELMHLVVVHFDVTCEISTSTLINADLLSELSVLHFELSDTARYRCQFSLFFFDKMV